MTFTADCLVGAKRNGATYRNRLTQESQFFSLGNPLPPSSDSLWYPLAADNSDFPEEDKQHIVIEIVGREECGPYYVFAPESDFPPEQAILKHNLLCTNNHGGVVFEGCYAIENCIEVRLDGQPCRRVKMKWVSDIDRRWLVHKISSRPGLPA